MGADCEEVPSFHAVCRPDKDVWYNVAIWDVSFRLLYVQIGCCLHAHDVYQCTYRLAGPHLLAPPPPRSVSSNLTLYTFFFSFLLPSASGTFPRCLYYFVCISITLQHVFALSSTRVHTPLGTLRRSWLAQIPVCFVVVFFLILVLLLLKSSLMFVLFCLYSIIIAVVSL